MTPFFDESGVTIYCGDNRAVLRELPDASINCCVTSPPYWGLRDYGVEQQIGLEASPDAYVAEMVAVFREVRRVLKDDGTCWLNIGDSYFGGGRGGNPEESSFRKQATNAGSLIAPTVVPNGCKAKDLCGIPWLVAFALRADGWYLRSDIIWSKPNPMPESVTDRPTKAHEYIFLLTKSDRYFYDSEAIKEKGAGVSGGACFGKVNRDGPGSRRMSDGENDSIRDGFRNRRSVWTVTTQPYSGAHFATFPPKLIEPCVRAGCPSDGVVLDPFFGAGTTGVVCREQHVRCIGIELNPEYCGIASRRLAQSTLPFTSNQPLST